MNEKEMIEIFREKSGCDDDVDANFIKKSNYVYELIFESSLCVYAIWKINFNSGEFFKKIGKNWIKRGNLA